MSPGVMERRTGHQGLDRIPHSVRLLFLSILFLSLDLTHAHVGLTFPPARKYDLDFLDNVRTKPPCGMPKGSVKTSLVSGSTFNVTWHLSYPHQGGFRLELMDANEKQLMDLTPRDGKNDYIRGDPTAQSYQVKLPEEFTCSDCTVRLLREASEWTRGYRFWSCADVSIVPRQEYKESCSGHGRATVGRCICSKGFRGNRCQYEDECETNKECSNGNGQCIDLGGTALPRKQCFCNPGFHGEKCSKRNRVRLPDANKPLDISQHTKRVLSDRMTLYYKVIPARKLREKEIEFVLEIDGTSYGALGWRPATFGKSCQRWPFIENSTAGKRQGKKISFDSSPSNLHPDTAAEPEPKAEGEPEPKAEGEPEPKAEGEPEPKAEGEPEPKAEGEPEPIAEGEPIAESEPVTDDSNKTKYDSDSRSEPEPDVEAEPKTEIETEPVAEGEPEPKAEPEATSPPPKSNAGKLRSKMRPKPKVITDGQDVSLESSAISVTRSSRKERSPESTEPEPEGEPVSEPEPEGEPSVSEPEPNSEGEPTGEPSSGQNHASHHEYQPSQLQSHEWVPKADFHAMDCIDLVMGGARGKLSRVLDYYTRDRSTPRLDSFWGGQDDLTSATGWEKDGKTTLVFRRKVRSTDGSDHALDSGEMHVIWARGQEQGNYVHSPKSGLEAAGYSPSVPSFYAPDEIKYHGHGAQRGKTRINFMENPQRVDSKDAAKCQDSWSHPAGCSNDDPKTPCTYSASWRYIASVDSVQFTIQSRKPERWTGIGFGESPTMKNSDAILGWVTAAGRFFIMDTFMTSYVGAALDASQNINNASGTFEDGIVTLSFIRPVVSSDPKDVSLDACRFFLFPVEGGNYDPVSKKIGKHGQPPLTSADKVCIPRTCRPVVPPKPEEVRYNFDIKLVGGFANNWKPPTKGTPDFEDFGNRLRRDLELQLKEIDGFNRLQLTSIKKVGTEAVASLELMVKPNSELSEVKRVERALKDTIASGRAGSLQVDPTFLELSAPEVVKTSEDEETGLYPALIGTRLWIVIGCVAALILLALVQAVLTIYKSAGKPSSQKDTPSSGSGMAWRDYSETNYGYDGYDEKVYTGNGNTIPLRTTPAHHNGQSNYHNGHSGQSLITNMSLPRPQSQSRGNGPSGSRHHHMGGHHSSTYNGGGGHGGSVTTTALSQNNPDFYFMPSQRKYSGEVVRVYVDHNNKR